MSSIHSSPSQFNTFLYSTQRKCQFQMLGFKLLFSTSTHKRKSNLISLAMNYLQASLTELSSHRSSFENVELLKEALTAFQSCLCFPNISESNVLIIKIAFMLGIFVSLGDCTNCLEEVRITPDKGAPKRRLLLLSETAPPSSDYFSYTDVIVVQGDKLLRLDIPLAAGREFKAFSKYPIKRNERKLVDLNNQPFKIVFKDCPPHLFDLKGVKMGIEHNIIQIISKQLNFKVVYEEFNSSSLWGDQAPNGSIVGGVFSEVLGGRSDMIGCGLWVSEWQFQLVDMTAPIGRASTGFLITEVSQTENWKSIYSPFSYSLWISVSCTIIYSFSSMFILSRISGTSKTLMDWVFLVIGHFTGSCNLPTTSNPTGFRVAGVLVSTAALIISTLYGSSIICHLTKPPVTPLPTTIKDLVHRGYVWTRNTHVHRPTQLLRKDFAWHREFGKQFRSVETIERSIKDRRFALYVTNVDNFLLAFWEMPEFAFKLKVPVKPLKEKLFQYSLAFGFMKGHPLIPHVSKVLGRMWAAGIINKITRDIGYSVIGSWKNEEQSDSEPKSLTISILQGAFFLYLGGHICASLIFFIELCIAKKKKVI